MKLLNFIRRYFQGWWAVRDCRKSIKSMGGAVSPSVFDLGNTSITATTAPPCHALEAAIKAGQEL